MSVTHPAEFTLIGTMNPEEGDLRPQLRDRFDLQATVTGCADLGDRVDIIDRALGEGDEGESIADSEAVADLRESLRNARESIDSVSLPTEFKESIAELCTDAGVDGHRADIATARAAIAAAALDGRSKVIESDIEEVARYTLPHRLQSQPFEEPPDPEELLDDHFDEEDDADGEDDAESTRDDGESDGDGDSDGGDDSASTEGDTDESAGADESAESEQNGDDGDTSRTPERDGDSCDGESGTDGDVPTQAAGDRDERQTDESESESGGDAGDNPAPEDGDEGTEGTPLVPGQQRSAVGEAAAPDLDDAVNDADADAEGATAGQRGQQQAAGGRGTRVRTEPATGEKGVDAAASVRAAASRGHNRVTTGDLRQSVRERETAATIVFAVDASASMTPAMEAAKGVVLELLRDAYESRDEVAFVAFGGDDADVLLPPTRSVSLAARHLKSLPTGDRTPLPAGLDTARRVIDDAESELGVVVLVTDGRANVADGSPTEATRAAAQRLAASGAAVVIVDASDDRDGLIPVIAAATDAETVPLSRLSVERISQAVAQATPTDQ